MSNPVGWFEIYVEDMDRATAFYQTVLAVELTLLTDPTEEQVHMMAFPSDMEKYGASGALVKMAGMAPGGNSTLVYFSCEDCAVEAERVSQAGGAVEQAKTSIGEYGFISLIKDTEGNMVGLHSQA